MIEVFLKITHNIYDLIFNETRGTRYQLQNHSFHYDLRPTKHVFARNVNI